MKTVMGTVREQKGGASVHMETSEKSHLSDITQHFQQDGKEPGDFSLFLSRTGGSRVLEDTRGYTYLFKRTINKKNKFGKACKCGVWVCRQYRKLHCCCSVYIFADTIVGSTRPHNHHPIQKGAVEEKVARESIKTDSNTTAKLRNKIRRHNTGPRVESTKRYVQRAKDQLWGKRRSKKLPACKQGCTVEPVVSRSDPELATVPVAPSPVAEPELGARSPVAEPEIGAPSVKSEPELGAQTLTLSVRETESSPIASSSQTVGTGVVQDALLLQPGTCPTATEAETVPLQPATTTPTEAKADTLNEILEILNDMSKNSSHSYQLLCSQLLSEYMIPGAQEVPFPAEPQASTPPSVAFNPLLSLPSSTNLAKSSPTTLQMPPFLLPILPKSSGFPTSSYQTSPVRTFTRAAPPPNVTIINKDKNGAVNPDLRPIINLPQMYDPAPQPPVSSPPTTPSLPSSKENLVHSTASLLSSPALSSLLSSSGLTSNALSSLLGKTDLSALFGSSSPELPPSSEYNLLSDMNSLENLLDILKENTPIVDPPRCTCKTMLRCNLHDIGPGKKRQSGGRGGGRRVLARDDELPKPARKKYCYRGSKKPYKYIPETFKYCQLPANEETIIGNAHGSTTNVTSTARKGRGGRRGRGSKYNKPINIPPPPALPRVPAFPLGSISPHLTPISPAPPPESRHTPNTISLVPVTSVSAPNFENSKLLKAVPIGNGLYRLEETTDISAGGLSEPILTPHFGAGGMTSSAAGSLFGSGSLVSTAGGAHFGAGGLVSSVGGGMVCMTGSSTPPFAAMSRADKPLEVIEHHPASSCSTAPCHAACNTPTPQISTLLQSVLANMGQDRGQDDDQTALVSQLIQRLLSVECPDDKLLEALNSSLPGITQHS